MARSDHYTAYLSARQTAEYLVVAHAISTRDGDVAYYEELAERKFRQLADELGFRVEKLPAVEAEVATVEAA